MEYREITQQYAQGGIRAVTILNGGAAVALLTQLSELNELAWAVLWSMVFWSGGLAASAFTWYLAFAATRAFDEWQNLKAADPVRSDTYRVSGNRSQTWAIGFAIGSLLLFLAGCLVLALGYYGLNSQPGSGS